MRDSQSFSPIQCVAFSCCRWFPLLCRNFLFYIIPLAYFCFWRQIQKSSPRPMSRSLCFLLGVSWPQVSRWSLPSIPSSFCVCWQDSGPVFPAPSLRTLAFPTVCPGLLGPMLTDHLCVGLLPGSLFCSVGLSACFELIPYCFESYSFAII